jgi:hypothetical protein
VRGSPGGYGPRGIPGDPGEGGVNTKGVKGDRGVPGRPGIEVGCRKYGVTRYVLLIILKEIFFPCKKCVLDSKNLRNTSNIKVK